MVLRRLLSIFQSNTIGEESRRRQYILTVFLVSSIGLSLVGLLLILLISLNNGFDYFVATSTIPLNVSFFFLVLLLLSKKGKNLYAASLLISTYVLLGSYCVFRWGLLLQLGQLMFVLAIVMAGILVSSTASLVTTAYVSVFLILYFVAQKNGSVVADISWANRAGGLDDLLVYITIFGILAIFSWLSNRELDKSLKRARASEAELLQQRDSLEVTVAERTKDLEKSQQEKITQLYRFAEFGKLASGVIHDLVSPLTTVSLNLEQMDDSEESVLVRRALEGTKRMERFIEDARRQMRHQKDRSLFCLNTEINQAINSLSREAKEERVLIQFSKVPEINLYGSSIRFNQIITNLLCNAIDSYKQQSSTEKLILLSLESLGKSIFIRIQDFGSGIEDRYRDKVFEPFFTTKAPEDGTGMGLSICKEIVEKEFEGSIQVVSQQSKGTIFTIEIPYDKSHRTD